VVAHRIPSIVHPSRARMRSAKAMMKIQKRRFMGISGFVVLTIRIYGGPVRRESAREPIPCPPQG
jgi:hypothetical protein